MFLIFFMFEHCLIFSGGFLVLTPMVHLPSSGCMAGEAVETEEAQWQDLPHVPLLDP